MIPDSLQTQVLIVGGGIVGAGALRDLALHGINATLIEKKEFASQTSSKSSKMLHGGIRYLEHLDFHLVFEALHEKNLWRDLAPDLVQEKNFIFPIYQDSPLSLLKLRTGLFLYDLLSGFKNSPHKMLSKKEVLKIAPTLNPKSLKGAGLYSDAIMDDRKLNLAILNDALNYPNANAYEYTSLVDIVSRGGQSVTAHIKDEKTGIIKKIYPEKIILSLGPFTDHVMKNLSFIKNGTWQNTWQEKLLPSKGSHLWIKKDVIDMGNNAVVMTANDGRVIFVIPHEDKTLVGTTEEAIDAVTGDDYFDITPSQKEIDYLIQYLNHYFPNVHLKQSDIIGSFAGVRPLAKSHTKNSGGTSSVSREHKVLRPHKDVYAIIGGKYTTFRTMVQKSVGEIVNELGGVYNNQKTKQALK